MAILTTNRSVINKDERDVPLMNNKEYFLVFLLAAFLLFFLYLLAKRSFKIRPRNAYIVGGILFASIASIPIIHQSVLGNLSTFYSVARYLSFAFLLAGALVFTLDLFPRMTNGNFLYTLVSIGVILTALYGCIYSYIAEWNKYSDIFTGIFPEKDYIAIVPQSFTSNRNAYSWVLLMGQIGASYLETRKGRLINWILMIFFLINQIFVLSKTGLGLAGLLFLSFLIYRLIVSFRKRRKITLIILISVIVVLVVTLIVLLNVGTFTDTYLDYLRYALSVTSKGIEDSFNARLRIVEAGFWSLNQNPISLIFGFGYTYWYTPYYQFAGNYFAMDIAFMRSMLSNGFIGLGISLLLWGYVLFIIIKAMRNKMKGGVFFLFIYIIFGIRSFFELTDFLAFDVFGIMLYFFTYLPCASYLNKRKALLNNEEIELASVEKEKHPLELSSFYLFLTPIFALLIAFYPTFGLSGYYLLFNLVLAFIFFPMFLYGFYYGYKKRNKEITMVVGITFSLLYLGSSIIFPFFLKDIWGTLIPLMILITPLVLFHAAIDKDIMKGQIFNYIYPMIILLAVGGGFFYINNKYFSSLSTFALVFLIVDIVFLSLTLGLLFSRRSHKLWAYREYQCDLLSHNLEVIELTGLFVHKEKRLEEYRKLDIYNLESARDLKD